MERLTADVHTHTLASGHAYETIREMAQAAAGRELEVNTSSLVKADKRRDRAENYKNLYS